MRSRNLDDKAVVGQAATWPSDVKSAAGFDLLGAAPFEIIDNHDFIWPFPKLVNSLLRSHAPAPKNVEIWQARLSDEGRRARAEALKGLTWDGARYCVTYTLYTDDARHISVEERGHRISGVDNRPTRISSVIRNIDTETIDAKRAAYLSTNDELTGLWNKARFCEGLDYLIAIVNRNRQTGLYLRLQLANLDEINSTYGFETGDKLLQAIAGRLHDISRAPDLIARVEKDSFGLGLYNASEEDLDVLVSRLKSALSERPYSSFHGLLFAQFDIGVTVLGDKAHSAYDSLEQARIALDNKTDRAYTIFSPDMAVQKISEVRHQISADDILAALNDRRISLAYQPIVDAKTRELNHYECLLRLRTDEGEVISAARFILAAEKLGLIHMLDRRALEIASATLNQYPDIKLALNVSAGTVKDMDVADAYIGALKALGPAVSRVTLELTETVALEDPAMASRFSVEARTLGCEFAIDDFGAGYTTFRNLMAIEADTIKIDGSFIQDIASSPYKQTFVRMMVDLAQTFSVTTVAEMVDSHADADLLKRLGVDYLQGYMFGIPSAAPAWRQVAS